MGTGWRTWRWWVVSWVDTQTIYVIKLYRKNTQTNKIIVQLLSHVPIFATPWTTACQAPQFFTISQSFLDSCPLSWWFYLTISSSATPFSFCLQSFPASRSFLMSWLFASGGQRIEVSASLSNELSGLISFRIDWFDFHAVQGTLQSLLNSTVQNHQFFSASL